MNLKFGRSRGIALLTSLPFRPSPRALTEVPLQSPGDGAVRKGENFLRGIADAWCILQNFRSATGTSSLFHKDTQLLLLSRFVPSYTGGVHGELQRTYRTSAGEGHGTAAVPRSRDSRSEDSSYANRTPRESTEPGNREPRRPPSEARGSFLRYESGRGVSHSGGNAAGFHRERPQPSRPRENEWENPRAQPPVEGREDRFSRQQPSWKPQEVPDNRLAWQKRAAKRLGRHEEREEAPRREMYIPDKSERERWYERRVASLAVEIKRLKPAGVVLLLNAQRSWIEQRHITKIIYNLVDDGDSRRGLRVMRWMLQRTEWYCADYDLYTKLMEGLLRDKKPKKALEVYEIAINHGMKPEASTYVAFLHKLTKEGELDVALALDMYKSMKVFAGHKPPPGVQRRLIKMLCLPGYGAKYGRQAAGILQDMQDAGTELDENDFADVAYAMAVAADGLKLDELVMQMTKYGLEPGQRVLTSVLHACGKDGRVDRAKEVHKEMLSKGIEVSTNNLEDMMLACQRATDAESALSIFEDLTAKDRVRATPAAYSTLIKTVAGAGKRKKAEDLLKKMELKSVHHKDLLRDTSNAVMHAYAIKGDVNKVEALYRDFESAKLRSNKETFYMRLKSLVRAGRLAEARAIYDRMWAPGAVRPDMATFNLMVEAYGEKNSKVDIRTIWDHVQAQPGKLELSPRATAYVKSALSKKEVKEEVAKRLTGKLKDEHKETLIGLLLGGASMVSRDSERTFEFVFAADEGDAQRTPVLQHVHRLMSDWCEKPPAVVPRATLEGLLAPGGRASLKGAPGDEGGDGEEGEEGMEEEEEGMGLGPGKDELVASPDVASESAEDGDKGGDHEEEVAAAENVMHVRTMSHGSFRFYAHQFHPQERNVIPRLIHRWLSPRTLAFWYMYGGYRCPSTGGVVLYAQPYTTKEVQLVVNALKKRQMDAERKLRKDGNVIRLEGKSATWFWRLVYPHILPQLHEMLEPIAVPLDDKGVGFTFRDDPNRNPYKLKRMREQLELARREEERRELEPVHKSSAW